MTRDTSCDKCPTRSRIYDCFTFFNETELVELRMDTIGDHVDYFVVVEAASTFTGKPKPYNFVIPEKWEHKVRYIMLPKLPHKDPWHNEFYQRNAIMRGLYDAAPDDIILVSDADEIPSPEAIEKGRAFDKFTLNQKLFYYYVNCLQKQEWMGTMGVRKAFLTTPQDLRNQRGSGFNVIADGGWHYSFLGDVKKISEKLNAFAETQVNIPKVNNPTNIARCLETGADLFHRTEDWAQKRFVDEHDHPGLGEWLKKYPHFWK